MKIRLVEIECGDKVKRYKNKPYECCCKEMEKSMYDGLFVLGTREYDMFPSFLLKMKDEEYDAYDGSWSDAEYIDVGYCPFCGEKIEFKVIEHRDVSKEAGEIYEKIKLLWNKKNKKAMEEYSVLCNDYATLIGECDRTWMLEEQYGFVYQEVGVDNV